MRDSIADIITYKDKLPSQLALPHVIIEQWDYRIIPDFQIGVVRENAEKAARQRLEVLEKKPGEAGFTIELRLEFGGPHRVIPRIANEKEYQLLVTGRKSECGEIRDVLFGSVANYVLHNVKCPGFFSCKQLRMNIFLPQQLLRLAHKLFRKCA